ncbi:MAG: metallophosphoesterase [Bacteroides sp.]|nr:metallophosphoesterase [Bacteroides sp.]
MKTDCKTALFFAAVIALAVFSLTAGAQDPARFEKQIEQVLSKEYSLAPDKELIIFTGSSSIVRWNALESDYPQYNVINYGFGGSQFSDLIFYYEKLVKNPAPDILFIYEGDNDIASGKDPEQVFQLAKNLFGMIRKDLPQTEIVVISPKPCIVNWDKRENYIKLNVKLEGYCEDHDNLDFFNVWDLMVDVNGVVLQDIFVEDGDHMNAKGYQIWNKALSDFLKQTTVHSSSDYEATIAISGLKKTSRILHVADSHISVFDEGEEKYHPYGARMDHAYDSVPHYITAKNTTPVESFSELMELAESQNFDLLALTGDIINNPSKSSVKFVLESVQKTGIPSIYLAGNHDWHYEGMTGSMASLRQSWIENSLLPLYGGSNPFYSSHMIGGINYVAIDNSTYQIDEKQLTFFKEQEALNVPIVLLMHIPLYLPKDAENENIVTCGDPRWGWDADKGYEVEQRERWSRNGNLPSTIEFREEAKSSTNLVAILVGHTHKARADQFSATAVQYVTGRSVDGQHRIVTFIPLN